MIGTVHLHDGKVAGIDGQLPSVGGACGIQVVIPPAANTDLDGIEQRDHPLFMPTLYHRSQQENPSFLPNRTFRSKIEKSNEEIPEKSGGLGCV